MATEREIDPETEDPNNEPGPDNPPAFPARPASPRVRRLRARFQWQAGELELIAEGDGPPVGDLPAEAAE